jgi:hypothetical protein
MLCNNNRAADVRIPTITCPVCGEHMFLCTIEPDDRLGDRMTFVSNCGFEYRQSTSVPARQVL